MSFVLSVTVTPGDLDDYSHVNNLVYIKWIQDVAVAHSQALGLGFPEYLARGAGFVVRRQEVDYLRAAVLGDVIEVETRVIELRPASSTRQTEIRSAGQSNKGSNGKSDNQVLYARAITSWAYVELSRGRPVRIPEDIRSRFPIDPPFPWAHS